MTPQEKAKDLYDSYWYCLFESNITQRNYWTKQCALIAVDEIILEMDNVMLPNKHYWNEVNQEIEKI